MSPTQPLIIGQTLRNRRLQRNLTLETIAKDTRIHSRFLKSLEEEKWEEFPARIYLQGFLRQYASYLGLDGDEMAAELSRQTGQGEQPPFAPPRADEDEAGDPLGLQTLWRWGVVALMGVAVLLYVVIRWDQRKRAEEAAVSSTAVTLPARPAVVDKPEASVHQFSVRVLTMTNVRVWVDQVVKLEGNLPAGYTQTWRGQTMFRVWAADLSRVEVKVDGQVGFSGGPRREGEYVWPAPASQVPPTKLSVSTSTLQP